MKENMKKRNHILFPALLLLTLLLAVTAAPVKTQAASARTNALKAYNKLLSRSTITWGSEKTLKVKTADCQFGLAYIDSDSVPELIIYTTKGTYHMSGYGLLYTYRNGKLKFAGNLQMDKKFRYYKKKGIFLDSYIASGYVTNWYCRLYKGVWTTKYATGKEYYDFDQDGKLTTTYYKKTSSGNTKISKTKFVKGVKAYTGSTKVSALTLHKNTKAMRNKYLK